MSTIECIRLRSCRPNGEMLAKILLDTFYETARSQGFSMTVWLDRELAGDLFVHLEKRQDNATNHEQNSLSLAISQMLERHGLVSRRFLISTGARG